MESLEWSECNETLDDILKNPRVQLPQLIKLSTPFIDISNNERLEEDQIVVIHSKETVEKVQGNTHDGKKIEIPLGCPHKTRRRVSPGKEKVFESIGELAKAEPLPRFVEVKEVEGLENLSNGDRLKVVIVEKTGGVPAFIHFRSSSGKHVKISIDEKISFQSSVSDGSDQSIAKLAEKSREFPICAEFQKKDIPKSHTDLGVFTIEKCSSEIVVVASAKKSDEEYAVIFPLDSNLKFKVNSNLKMAKNEVYRQLCENSFSINPEDIVEYLNHANPTDSAMQHIIRNKMLLKIIRLDYSVESSPKQKTRILKKDKKEQSKKEKKHSPKSSPLQDKKDPPVIDQNTEDTAEVLPPNTLAVDSEQKVLLKKEMKEREKQAKLERERLKAEKKKEKKLQKEKEKEEKKKKKSSTSSLPSSPVDINCDELYMSPQDDKRAASPSPSNTSAEPLEEQHSHLTMFLMNKVKKVRDRTQSLGLRTKNKKRGKLRKEDIQYISNDPLAPEPEQDSLYTGLNDDAFSESLYEALPGEMAYESLDLVAQAQRSLAPQPTNENSGDSGFDEIDQARIQAWRESMAPPPLPGNHPLQQNITQSQDENLYETAVDCRGGMPVAWQSFYNSVEQSTTEIASWDMEDVASCLTDILLTNYIEVFSDSQVDGRLLLDLDESVLRDLGLNPFEARKLRKFVFGWRPDVIRPPAYPNRIGYDSDDPSQWSQEDAVKHLKVIEIDDFADFCEKNQVNGELLKDICVDENIMGSIITTRDRKLKTVKIKNYVIDKWRPKKKGEGNYVSSQSILPPEKRALNSPNMNKNGSCSPKPVSKQNAPASPTIEKGENSPKSFSVKNTRKISESTTLGVNRKGVGGDMPLIARMKQQLEENKNAWENRKT